MPSILNIRRIRRQERQSRGVSENMVDGSPLAREIVDVIGQTRESAARSHGKQSSVIDRAHIPYRKQRHVAAKLKSVAPNRITQSVLKLVGVVAAPLRKPCKEPEGGRLPCRPQQVRDTHRWGIKDRVRQRLCRGSKFQVKLAIGPAQFVHGVRGQRMRPSKTEVERNSGNLRIKSRQRIRLVEKIGCKCIVVAE